MWLIVTCTMVRGRGKIVLFWQLLIRFFSLTTKHTNYIVTSQTRRKGTFDIPEIVSVMKNIRTAYRYVKNTTSMLRLPGQS